MSDANGLQGLPVDLAMRRETLARERDAETRGFWCGVFVGMPSGLIAIVVLIAVVRIIGKVLS